MWRHGDDIRCTADFARYGRHEVESVAGAAPGGEGAMLCFVSHIIRLEPIVTHYCIAVYMAFEYFSKIISQLHT